MLSVLFESHHLYYLPNFLPIIKEMQRRGTYEIFTSIPDSIPKQEKNIFYQICNEQDISTIVSNDEQDRIQVIKNKKFDIIIIGNIGQIEEIAANHSLVVMVYHGIGLKQTYYNDIVERIDIRAVESKSRYEILSSQGHSNLIINGYTKCDPLININNQLDDYYVKVGLDKNKKTILYAPSFYPSSIEKLYPELELFSNEFNLIIKLHNFSWFQKRYKYQSEMMKNLNSKLTNLYLAQPHDYDVIPFMRISDLLISDISSTIFEYLPLNRPIIMAECLSIRLKHRILKKRFTRKLDLERYDSIDFVHRMNEPGQLNSLVYHCIEYPNELSDLRLGAIETYLYKNDGKASSRLIDEIENKLPVA